MRYLPLDRILYHEDATVGRLTYPGGWCYTLEDPWRENAVRISCVPEGWYRLRRDTFRGLYPNFRFLDVVGRSDIEIHKGNTDENTEGCLLLGAEILLDSNGQLAIPTGMSAPAFDRFMQAMTGVLECVLMIQRSRGPSVPRLGGS